MAKIHFSPTAPTARCQTGSAQGIALTIFEVVSISGIGRQVAGRSAWTWRLGLEGDDRDLKGEGY